MRIHSDLAKFSQVYELEKFSGFAFDAAAVDGSNLEKFNDCVHPFRSVLCALLEIDGLDPSLLWANIEDYDWQYSLCGLRLFVNLFAPCYPPRHTKHLPVLDRIVLFLQPERSFDFCDVNSSRGDLRRRIRERFAKAGRPYSGDLIDTRIEAHLYVFPLEIGDPIVRWWEE